jgi:hypothetical protein
VKGILLHAEESPVELHDLDEIAAQAREVVARFRQDYADILIEVEVHHIGATAMPLG